VALTEAERRELEQIEAAFEAAGGRGVDLAERLDALRAKAEVQRRAWRAPVALTPESHSSGSFAEATAGKPGLYISFACGRRGAGSVMCQFCGAPIDNGGGPGDEWWVDDTEMPGEQEFGGGAFAPGVFEAYVAGIARCERHDPGREMGPVFGPFQYGELTYQWLRVDDGEHLAVWDAVRGDWAILEGGGDYENESYSDITIAYYG
jgi:hypothetical protein